MFTDRESFKELFVQKLKVVHGKELKEATRLELYKTLALMVREIIMESWMDTRRQYQSHGVKEVYYFSLEFMMGRFLENNLINLGIVDICRDGLGDLGLDLFDIVKEEPDAGLGNGGLGRLAACFLDSMASQAMPGHGMGVRYKYGLFEQRIKDGYQVELPEYWLREGNVWEKRRSDETVEIRFGGEIKEEDDKDGKTFYSHEGGEVVRAVPYDTPVVGYLNNTVNNLRLWHAEAAETEVCETLGCYRRVVEYRHSLESITQLLYPDDTDYEGKELRLRQQYFLVSAGLQDIVRRHRKQYGTLENLHHKIAIHINDTHPVLTIPELMRIFLDEEEMEWEKAWEITTSTVSYTNHTIMVEALEVWPVDIFRPLLPRIYFIVEEINRRFCAKLLEKYPENPEKAAEMAIIGEGEVRMAHLAVVGSHSVNGVARLHTEILKQREMNSFYRLYPEKFNNKTNGITHRFWLLKSNPYLAQLVNQVIGPEWIRNPRELSRLEDYAGDNAFQEQVYQVKCRNKVNLARLIKEKKGLTVDVDSVFDVHVKRLHPYKRQLLKVMHIMHLYNLLQEDPGLDITPRTFIFGAKAFPHFELAKCIIKLINTVADKVNRDKKINDKLKVVFLENYRVSLASRIFPAADLSEQISTASKEASGTGNMKFMLNGALTIGTMDGANVEIAELVGKDNIFIFGLTAEQVLHYQKYGGYNALKLYDSDPRIKLILDQLVNGFLPAPRDEFFMIREHLLDHHDEFFVLRDFASYVETQQKVAEIYQEKERWRKKCIHNIARAGYFSSDLTIQNYAAEIWNIEPFFVKNR